MVLRISYCWLISPKQGVHITYWKNQRRWQKCAQKECKRKRMKNIALNAVFWTKHGSCIPSQGGEVHESSPHLETLLTVDGWVHGEESSTMWSLVNCWWWGERKGGGVESSARVGRRRERSNRVWNSWYHYIKSIISMILKHWKGIITNGLAGDHDQPGSGISKGNHFYRVFYSFLKS